MLEKVSAKDAVERMSAATSEATNDMQHSYAVLAGAGRPAGPAIQVDRICRT